MKGIKRTFAGVDWSGGGAEIKGSEGDIKSRTIIHICHLLLISIQYIPAHFKNP
jgi:hypothetical protein